MYSLVFLDIYMKHTTGIQLARKIQEIDSRCQIVFTTNSTELGILGIAMAFGLSIVAMAYAIGDVSGCHINPAVSLGVFLSGGMSAKDFGGSMSGATMKTHTWPRAVPLPTKRAGPKLLAGFTLVPVSGIPRICTNASVSPITSPATVLC